ncbi:olfactomedin-like protein 2B isoform X2 [Artibeus jamaicensis]|uniref:olfactomedin-like protein 2B isoform X2 n=1 Tax=Artibeus jamaicensis TaxID=9417 RepID=UPI00235AA35B|nr:olfactomedin-like protein 2B isoform X2 [Artibeus jamaicensis]
MAKPLLLVLCLTLGVARGCASSAAPTGTSEPPVGTSEPPAGTSEPPLAQTVAPTEAETLQNEADNQENILSQLLGDYDKVKAVSEGANCQCKCVVRPMAQDACRRAHAGGSRQEDFYTVETITSGPACKCSCVAPPSALNPCEGDFRLQKLREADSQDLKLATIIDMLEGAFYGLDLLKLHSVTTKLVGRVDKLEEEVSKNLTKESEQIKEDVEGIRAEMNKQGRENCSQNAGPSLLDVRSALQRDAAAAYAHPETFLREATVSQHVNSVELPRPRPLAPPELRRPQRPLHRQVHLRGRPASKPTIIRGVTYYKAKEPEDENDIEEQQDELFSGDGSVDLLIEDQLLRHDDLLASTPRRAAATRRSVAMATDVGTEATVPFSTWPHVSSPWGLSVPDPTVSAVPEPTSTPVLATTLAADPPGEAGVAPSTQAWPTTEAPAAPQPSPAPAAPPAAPGDMFLGTTPLTQVSPTTVGTDSLGKEAAAGPGTAPASPTPNPEEADDIRNVIGRCKDTLSTITGPTTQNTYGRNEGAWMKDPLASDERIYVTNYYYGNALVEFRNLESFKQGRWSNSYKLPYSWVGTGHVVYGGAFYYSRAFTRNLIKYDLRRRFVAAWALLHDVAYEEASPWGWQGRSDVDFAVDENGLWLIYPALDEEGFGQEVIVLSKLNAADLSTRKETTWRTGLRRHLYGNCFVICGVLYAVDSHDQRNANISYAFDTHTNTQIVPRLLFENEYAYTTQVDYNPKDRLLYAWDNGHQVTYRVIFAY